MTDGIGKGVGQQLGSLGKHIASEVAKVPATLTGMATESGTQETKGQGAGSSKQQGGQTSAAPKSASEQVDPLAALRQKDEIEKQKRLARIREELTAQFKRPAGEKPKTAFEEKELEELEKKKLEIKKMQEEAKQLKQVSTKAKRGNLLGIGQVKKQKTFASEQSKNAVHQ